MKRRSIFGSLFLALASILFLFWQPVAFAVTQAVKVYREVKQTAWKLFGDLVRGALALAARMRDLNPISIRYAVFKAFCLRMLSRRQRPYVTPNWRACPST
jgi:hypothetical protein